jgi:GntR family transcriptional regulator/MocR family aminotransferase
VTAASLRQRPATQPRLGREPGCSRWVVSEAYAQLAAEGYLEARVGSGTRVRSLGPAAWTA